MDDTKFFTNEAPAYMMSQTEEARQTESVSFTELYRKNVTPVFYYLYSRVHNTVDAEDLTSQTFVTALENLSRLRDTRKFTPWVFTIARNKAIDFFRKSHNHPTTDYSEEVYQAQPVSGNLTQADQDRLRDLECLISRLRPIEQEYLRLRIVADLPFAEIASILGEPETRIKKKYYRLLEHLHTQMED